MSFIFGNIKNIFIVFIVVVLIILIFNYFFLTTNIIWDNLTQGQTIAGISASLNESVYSSKTVPTIEIQNTSTKINDLAKLSTNTGLIVPNNVFPSIMTSNFMFSIWFFIDDYTTNLSKYKIIASTVGKDNTNDVPTLITFLTPNTNNLGIGILTQSSTSETQIFNIYYIQNIPIQKWNCLIISVIDRTMDIYLEGKLINSFILESFFVPASNTSLYIGNSTNFFSGFITRARIANGGVNPEQAYSIYREGIKTSYAGDFFNRYRLKVGLYEYNNKVSGFTI